jgi:glutamate-1-semialdehyde 2,1-aminomutase
VRSPADAAKGNTKARDLYFFDMQKAGFWLARRGMLALSVPLTEADYDAYVAATEEFIASRRALLT